jgi:D-beta-D-heptose 7-phosphate kinase/D-beta-D-heptose 1-phosphate adenosyltransferase
MKKPILSLARVKKVLPRLKKVRILVLGDLMLDRFIYGRVTRISPEAPVPVVRVDREVHYPGGAANVARNLADFGIRAEIGGVVGRDEASRQLLRLMKTGGIGTGAVLALADRPTIVKTRVIARQQQVVRVDREEVRVLAPQRLKQLFPRLAKAIRACDAVILEDYGKGFLTQGLVDVVLTEARKLGRPVTVDPNPNNPLDWSGADLVKPNRSEAFACAGVPVSDDPRQVDKVGRILVEKWGGARVLITLGEDGMKLFSPDEPAYPVPARAREVFDVSGAGDTAIAFYTAALAAGMAPWEAAEISNHASSVVVGKLGTATITDGELLGSFVRSADL